MEDIKRMIDSERYISFINDEANYLYSQIGGRIAFDTYEMFNHTRDNDNYFIEEKLVEIEEFIETLTTANSTKAYWCLVKVLDGYDSKYYYDGEKKAYTETMVFAFTTSEKNQENKNFNESLIKVIKSVAQFYINHIPTYSGKLQTTLNKNNGLISKYENNLAHNHLFNNDLSVCTFTLNPPIDEVNHIWVVETPEDNSNFKCKVITTYELNDHNEFIYYPGTTNLKVKKIEREFNKFGSSENKPMYYTNNIGYYKWKEYINKYPTKNDDGSINVDNDKPQKEKVNNNFNGRNARDDCSGLVMLVYDIMENKKVGNIDYYTKKLMEIDSDISKELFKQGYVMYKKETGNWKKYKNNGENLTETVENNVNLSILEPGDLLVCNSSNTGHAEFYVGDGYSTKYTIVNNKKSGLTSITTPNSFALPSTNDIKAEGTFSWGSVRDEFPVESGSGHKHYFYYDSTTNIFRHCECGQDPITGAHDKCDFNNREFTVIWRKK